MLGLCCCGCEPVPAPVLRYIQSTVVAGGGSPYTRPYAFGSCAGVVGDVCQYQGFDAVTLTEPNKMTGVAGSSGGDLVSQIADNYFSNSGGTLLEFPSHCIYGWKAVSAKAFWQGRWGFMSGSCCDDVSGSVKYRTITEITTASAYVKNESKSCGVTVGGVLEEYFTVNTTKTASVDDYGNITKSGGSTTEYRSLVDGIETSRLTWCDENHTGFKPSGLGLSEHRIPGGDMPLTASCGIITIGGNTPGTNDVPETTGTAAEINALELFPILTEPYVNPCTVPEISHAEYVATGKPITLEISDNRLSAVWELEGYGLMTECCDDVAVSGSRTDYTVNYEKVVSLSGEERYDAVLARATGLLGEFPLDDDRIYPWRTDNQAWLVPHVTTDSAGREPSVAGFDPVTCEIVQDTLKFSGDIRGAPLPVGFGPYYNYFHKVVSAFIDGGNCSVNYDSDGELGASPLPISATQWTQKDEGSDSRGNGAHIYNVIGGQYGAGIPAPFEGVVVQKWAETLVRWPSINFARPCARDRYLFDETIFVCGTLVGYDLTLEDSASLSGKVVIEDGVYQITGGSGLNYTVGDRLYDALVSCDGVSPLRFPSARAICSTLNVTAVQTSPGLVTVSCIGNHWLKRGGTESDTVTFTGIGGLTSAVATVASDTEFTVPGTITTSPSSGTVSDGGSAWDSTCSRHMFLAREWNSNFRGAAENGDPAYSVTETEVTLSPITKHPTVLYCSPNDTFPHGYSIPWGSVAYDGCYGSQWSARFEQAIADPFWQADHVPCGHSGEWSQHDQPCTAPDSNHYAFPPLVEARGSTPPGAPTLPVDFFTAGEQGIPGPVGHPNCSIDPYAPGFAMSWHPAWLTCTDWQELIGHRC